MSPTVPELEAWVVTQENRLRHRLAGMVVATATIRAARPSDGATITVPAGTELPSDHPIALHRPDVFRPLSRDEVTLRLKGARAGWRLESGLP